MTTPNNLQKNIVVIDPTKCKDRAEFAEKLVEATTDFKIDLVAGSL